MKKILLIIAITLCIFQMVVLATAIDIGVIPFDGGQSWSPLYTLIDRTNPANDTGTITEVQIWAEVDMTGIIVAIFEEVDTNKFTSRDSEGVANVTAGSSVSRSVSLDVVIGDFIGIYFATGYIENSNSGGSGMLYLSGNQTACSNTTFTLYDADAKMSLYGTGATEEEEEEANAIFFGINF